MKKRLFLVGFTAAVLTAHAADITINLATTGNVGWNTAIWGDPATAPTNINNYIHDGSASASLLGMGTTHGSFAGNSLRLQSGATLYNKGGGALGGTLFLDGGAWQTRSPGNAILLGNVRVESDSTVVLVDGSMEFRTGLSSTTDAVFALKNFTQSGRSITVAATDSGFLGTFSVRDSDGAVTWDIQFNQSYSNATLKVEGQKNDAAYASIYQLTNNIVFKYVKFPSTASGVLVDLEAGVYDAAALAAAGVSGDYYVDQGGSIEVLGSEVYIDPTVSGIQDWNGIIWGNPAAAPTNGYNYVNNIHSSFAQLLGMGLTYGSFDGDSLRLDAGTVLYNKGGGPLGCTLKLNGGRWDARSPGNAIILGNVHVMDDSTILLVDGDMELRTGLSSVSNAVLTIANFNNNRTMVIDAVDSGFLGTIQLDDSWSDPLTWDIRFARSYPNATLRFSAAKALSYAPVYQLTNTIQFADVFMADDFGGEVHLAPGAYDGAALAAAGVSSFYYDDLGGIIQVGPPAAAYGYDKWAEEWDAEIGAETDDYDNDLFNNLYEYAFNGNPTNDGIWGEDPSIGNADGTLAVVHVLRNDDTNLVYWLETTENLISPAWTNMGYSVVGTNVTGGSYDYVTNAVSTSKDETFVRLKAGK